jgi:transcriptional regulator with XRE-family HTH domain
LTDRSPACGPRPGGRNDLISITDLPGLGDYVAARRHQLNLRSDELAARLDMEVAWLWALEDGALPGIEPGMLVQLAVALEVDQAILMHHAHLPTQGRIAGHTIPNLTYLIEQTGWRSAKMEQEQTDG